MIIVGHKMNINHVLNVNVHKQQVYNHKQIVIILEVIVYIMEMMDV